MFSVLYWGERGGQCTNRKCNKQIKQNKKDVFAREIGIANCVLNDRSMYCKFGRKKEKYKHENLQI